MTDSDESDAAGSGSSDGSRLFSRIKLSSQALADRLDTRFDRRTTPAEGGPVTSSVSVAFADDTLIVPVRHDSEKVPQVVTMTELGQRAGEVVARVEQGEVSMITKRGRFVGVIVPVDSRELEEALLDVIARSAPRRAAACSQTEAVSTDELLAGLEIEAGERGRS